MGASSEPKKPQLATICSLAHAAGNDIPVVCIQDAWGTALTPAPPSCLFSVLFTQNNRICPFCEESAYRFFIYIGRACMYSHAQRLMAGVCLICNHVQTV